MLPLPYQCRCLTILPCCGCTSTTALQLGNPHSLSIEAQVRCVNANCFCLFSVARLYVQLVDLFQFYMMFPIDDHTGDPVSDEDVTAAHYEKVQQVGICTCMFTSCIRPTSSFVLAEMPEPCTQYVTHPQSIHLPGNYISFACLHAFMEFACGNHISLPWLATPCLCAIPQYSNNQHCTLRQTSLAVSSFSKHSPRCLCVHLHRCRGCSSSMCTSCGIWHWPTVALWRRETPCAST